MYNSVLKCAFVRIPKVCGYSIKNALTLKPLTNINFLHHQHPIATDFEKFFEMNGIGKENIFKFGLVRNPWDRIFSMYNFFRYNRQTEIGLLAKDMDFTDWVHYCFEKEIKIDGLRTISAQYPRFFDKKENLFVDFIGKYEKLNKDWDTICKSLGYFVELPKINVSKTLEKKPYQLSYDKETKELIGRICQVDIEKFGYEFDKEIQ